MITRIVKMTFAEDHISTFLQNFHLNKDLIRNFDGCHHLELWQDIRESNVFWTYSIWESENHLNAYRESDLFKDVWSKTKILFAKKPEAWSLNAVFRSSQNRS